MIFSGRLLKDLQMVGAYLVSRVPANRSGSCSRPARQRARRLVQLPDHRSRGQPAVRENGFPIPVSRPGVLPAVLPLPKPGCCLPVSCIPCLRTGRVSPGRPYPDSTAHRAPFVIISSSDFADTFSGAFCTNTGRDRVEEVIDEIAPAGNVLEFKGCCKQSHPAVDIKTDTPGEITPSSSENAATPPIGKP